MSFSANIDDVVAKNRNGLLGAKGHWPRIRLREIAKIQNGSPFESARFSKDDGTPLIRIRDILSGCTETYYQGDFPREFLVERGDLLVGMDGDFHCALWQGAPALLNQRVCRITPDERKYDKTFLRYVLPGYLSAINDETSSVTVKHLSSKTIADIPLPIPSLEEQRRIVAEIETQLTRLDAGVVALKRVQANLKRQRASVLHAACTGQLVPTEASLARKSGHPFESGAALLARILIERRTTWSGRGQYKTPVAPDTTGLPSLPVGWCWARVAAVGESTTGFTPPTSQEGVFGGEIPFFKPSDLDAGYNVRLFRDSLTALGADHGRLIPARSILVTCIGATIGKTGFARVQCTTNQQINALTVSTENISPEFMFWFFNSPFCQEQIRRNASATTLPILNKSKFELLHIALPPLAEQHRIVAEVERQLSVIDELETLVATNLARATRLRQAVLHKAFSS